MPRLPSRLQNTDRQRAERGGRHGETLAALYLRGKFYVIQETRYKTPVGEIDLIASRLGTTVFVEVKTRRSRHGEEGALRAVNKARLVRAANYYVARHPQLADTVLRFDVIFLAPRAWPRHLKNAFSAN